MSVVRGQAARRWALVGAGVAALCLVPVTIGALPAPRAEADPTALRDRILAADPKPYRGYVDTTGRLGLPALPALNEVSTLLGGDARIRVWYASAAAWRVAQLDPTGERDIYRTGDGTYVWDFEANQVTYTPNELPVRLPRAADLPPPELARRLLGGAADGDAIEALPGRRIAGLTAAGLRLIPSDPDTSVGRIDVWAEPDSGFPLRVEVAGRGAGEAVFVSRFLQLDRATPGPAELTPAIPESAAFVVTTSAALESALRGVLPRGLPRVLIGRPATVSPGGVRGGWGFAGYGTGFGTFVALTLPGRLGGRMLAAADDAGATEVRLTGGWAFEMRASLLTALVVRADGDRGRRRTWLVAGLVEPDLLRRAAAELVAPR